MTWEEEKRPASRAVFITHSNTDEYIIALPFVPIKKIVIISEVCILLGPLQTRSRSRSRDSGLDRGRRWGKVYARKTLRGRPQGWNYPVQADQQVESWKRFQNQRDWNELQNDGECQ